MKKVISVVAALTLMLAAVLPWAATPSVAAAATPTISTGDYLVNPDFMQFSNCCSSEKTKDGPTQ